MRYMYFMLLMLFGLSFSIADAKNLPTKKELKIKEAAISKEPFGYIEETKDEQWTKQGRLRTREPTSEQSKKKAKDKKDYSREKSGRSHGFNSHQQSKPKPRPHRYSPKK